MNRLCTVSHDLSDPDEREELSEKVAKANERSTNGSGK